MTDTTLSSKQPSGSGLDYADPTKFKFQIAKLHRVEFNSIQANIPGEISHKFDAEFLAHNVEVVVDSFYKNKEESQNLKQVLLNSLDDKVLGPVNAPIYRVKGKYRQRLLIRSKKGSKIQNKLAEILNKHKLSSEIKLTAVSYTHLTLPTSDLV